MLKYSQRLRSAMGGHVAQLLRAGLSVVLDFPANRIEWRRWMLDIAEQAQSPHVLHFLDVPNEVCKARLKGRNAEGKHQYVVSDETFELILSRIELPSEAEGLNIQLEPWV
jgi:predicted kinase